MEKVILSLKVIHQVDENEEDFDENTEETTLNCLRFRVHQIICSHVYLSTTEG